LVLLLLLLTRLELELRLGLGLELGLGWKRASVRVVASVPLVRRRLRVRLMSLLLVCSLLSCLRKVVWLMVGGRASLLRALRRMSVVLDGAVRGTLARLHMHLLLLLLLLLLVGHAVQP